MTWLRIQNEKLWAPGGKCKACIEVKEQEAKLAATKDLTDVTITSSNIDHNWSWFPIPSAKGYELHPAWHFKITGKIPGSIPLKLTGYIDAINGALLYRTNEVKTTFKPYSKRSSV